MVKKARVPKKSKAKGYSVNRKVSSKLKGVRVATSKPKKNLGRKYVAKKTGLSKKKVAKPSAKKNTYSDLKRKPLVSKKLVRRVFR